MASNRKIYFISAKSGFKLIYWSLGWETHLFQGQEISSFYWTVASSTRINDKLLNLETGGRLWVCMKTGTLRKLLRYARSDD